jgi:multiple sugar transport system substrate-binding protein
LDHVRKDILEKAGVLDLLPFDNEEYVLMAAEKANQVEPGVYGIGLPLGGSGADCYWTFQIYYYGFGGGLLSDRSVEGAVFGKEPNRYIAKKTFAFEKDIYVRGLTPPDSGEWVDISNNMAFLVEG